jgi:hypothetical protein
MPMDTRVDVNCSMASSHGTVSNCDIVGIVPFVVGFSRLSGVPKVEGHAVAGRREPLVHTIPEVEDDWGSPLEG